MRDLRFISISDAIKIRDYYEVEDSSPPTLKIVTDGGVRYANRVYINGLSINSFTVLNDYSLLVTIPEDARAIAVSEMVVSVSSSRLTSRVGRTSLNFGPTKVLTSVSGIQKLVQQVVKELLSDVSSNRFNTADGGGLVKSLGSVAFTPSAASKISASIQASVSNTLATFQRNQLGSSIPADERLLSLEVSSVNFDESTGTANATIRLVSFAGVNFTIPLAL